VKAIEFARGDGAITRVEFIVPADCGATRSGDDEMPADYPRLRPTKER
jgi:hypothetical protein